jgi:cytoskeleton protein RodZ
MMFAANLGGSKTRGGCVVDSLGARLKQERERQKITLDEVAKSTKIGTRMLKALEDDHFDQLPGGIFNKGFVRAYARHLGMDEDQAIADYLAATGPVQPIKEPEVVLTALAVRADESRAVKPGAGDLPWDKLAGVLLLVAFGFALWGWRARKQDHVTPGEQSSPPAASSVPGPAVIAPLPPAAQPPASSSAESAVAPAPTSPPAPTQPPNDVQPAPSAAGGFLLLIQAHNDSWLDVTADGKDILHELLPAGGQKSVQAHGEIIVKAGNVGGLDFTFNGKKLPPQGGVDQVKTLKFDPNGLQAPVPGSNPPANPA